MGIDREVLNYKIILEDEMEDFQRQSIDEVLTKYNKIITKLFRNYQNAYDHKNRGAIKPTFDEVGQVWNSLSFLEVNNFLRKYQLGEYFKDNEIKNLFR